MSLPSIKMDGSIRLPFHLYRSIKSALNITETFNGTILNGDTIGLTTGEFVARWNEAHPDDPVEL